MSNEGNIKASILLILLKCIVAGYPNRNESLTGRLFSNYGSLNILLHFFRYLIYSVFHETFVKNFMKKLSFFQFKFQKPISRCSILQEIKMSNFVILKWQPFEGKKLKKLSIFGVVFTEIKNADILNFS